MHRFDSILLVFAFLTSGTAVATTPKDEEYKKGDEVIALRDAELRVEAESIGKLLKGDKGTVENVEGGWLWVRRGETHGWVEATNVISVTLKDWYERQSDMASVLGALSRSHPRVDKSGRGRAKVFGVTFDVRSVKPGVEPSTWGQVGGFNFENGVRVPSHYSVDYGDVEIDLVKVSTDASELRCTLSINGKRCGIAQRGDHVLVNSSRDVFVNGELRQNARLSAEEARQKQRRLREEEEMEGSSKDDEDDN